jgi:hypothetical protein
VQARFEKKKSKDEKTQEEFPRYLFQWASSTEEDEEYILHAEEPAEEVSQKYTYTCVSYIGHT